MKALRSSRSSASGYALWLSRRDQPKLGGSREPLDAGLLAKRGKAIGDRDHDCELNRAPTACIAAGRAGTVGSQTPLDVGGPAAIQGAIGAVQQWRYRPYLLEGQPVTVETVITVNFVMHQ